MKRTLGGYYHDSKAVTCHCSACRDAYHEEMKNSSEEHYAKHPQGEWRR